MRAKRANAKGAKAKGANAKGTETKHQVPTHPLERPLGDNHERVLDVALELVSEKGVAGASLRALARKLGMSQPSLYHYFESKDDLVLKLVEQCARKMLGAVPAEHMPSDPCRLPYQVTSGVLALWQTERHAQYARFLFAVAIEAPEHRPKIASVFDTLYERGALLGKKYELNRQQTAELFFTLRALAAALGLTLLEERVLFGRSEPSTETVRFAEWMAKSAAEHLKRRGVGRSRA